MTTDPYPTPEIPEIPDPEEQPAAPAERPQVVFTCQRCGEPMPPMDADLADVVKRNPDAAIAHAICPGEEPKKPTARRFEVRVSIVELTRVEDDRDPADWEETEEEFIQFRAAVEAKDLDSAMRPLADALGQKWMKAEKQAKVADS